MVSMQISTWIRGARPQTLPLGLAPVLVGVAASWRWEALGGLRSCPAFPGRLLEEQLIALTGATIRETITFPLVKPLN